MARLDTQTQLLLEPKRMKRAIAEIEKLGYKVTQVNETELQFEYDHISGDVIKYFPYSGWHTGKGIKDGRGLKKLLRQIK